jgi:beta-glucanase (GH16 family)
MKNTLTICFFYLSLVFLSAQDVYLWQVMKNRDVVVWGKSIGDEFNNNQLDESKWSYNYDWGKDSSVTGDYPIRENLIVKDGLLKLISKKQTVRTRGLPWLPDTAILADKSPNLRDWPYTNAVLFSKKKYLYGIYECKFKTPAEVGSWPAFWLFAGHPNKEIDIFEGKGERINDLHLDVHNDPEPSWFGGWYKVDKPLSESFATVRAQWDSNLVMYSINDKMVLYYFGSLKVEANLITNNTMVTKYHGNSMYGDFLFPMDKTTKFPNEMLVDYIRIWEKPMTYFPREKTALTLTKEIELYDNVLFPAPKNLSANRRKKWKFKNYDAKPLFEINMEVNYDKRTITFNTRGTKNELVKILVEDNNGNVKFEVKDIIESIYDFNTSYIGGNKFKVIITFSNQTVEQLINFKKNSD